VSVSIWETDSMQLGRHSLWLHSQSPAQAKEEDCVMHSTTKVKPTDILNMNHSQ